MMKIIMQVSLLGMLIGLSISYTIITIILLQNPTHMVDGQELFLEFLLAIILGFGCGITLLIFYIERWPITVKLFIHYAVSLLLVLACGAKGQWYESPFENPMGLIVFFVIHLAIYLVILGVIYWSNFQEVKSINEKLKRR